MNIVSVDIAVTADSTVATNHHHGGVRSLWTGLYVPYAVAAAHLVTLSSLQALGPKDCRSGRQILRPLVSSGSPSSDPYTYTSHWKGPVRGDGWDAARHAGFWTTRGSRTNAPGTLTFLTQQFVPSGCFELWAAAMLMWQIFAHSIGGVVAPAQ